MSAGFDFALLAARLAGLAAAVDRAAEAAVGAAAERARDHARAVCPVGRVMAENPHAAYVELGTGRRGGGSPHWPGMAARPYLRPALEAGRAAFLEDAAARLRAALGGDAK